VIYSPRFAHNTNERASNFIIFHIVIYDKLLKCPMHVYLITRPFRRVTIVRHRLCFITAVFCYLFVVCFK
jgi:hypothetical protein